MRVILALLFVLLPSLLYGEVISHPGGELDQWVHHADTIAPKPIAGKSETSTSRTVVVPSVGYSYQMVYNISGDWNPSTQKIASHISRVHGINPAGMSRAEMLAAHDRAHGVRNARAVRSYSAVSSCPNGRCPVSRPY